MSDKRATYVLGAVAVTFALVFGLIAAVPATSTTATMSSMDMMGHAVVVLKDMDGEIKAYQQSDNVVVKNGQNCAADLIFGIVGGDLCAGTAAIFDQIGIGSGTDAADDADLDLTLPIPSSVSPDRTGELISQLGATSGTGALKTIEGTFTLASAVTVAEVGLFDGTLENDELFSRINLGTPISAGTGDTVTITYVIEVG